MLVLDAMGVLFVVRSQVREALLGFCRSRGSDVSEQRLRDLYRAATSGELSTDDLWRAAGLDPTQPLDEAYVRELSPNPDAFGFLSRADATGWQVGCITNHTRPWMRLLRERHGLDRFVAWWTVSDQVGARKPDAAIYESFLATAGARPEECVLVDDLPQNLEGARGLGFITVAFAPPEDPGPGHVVVEDFAGLASLVLDAGSPLRPAPPPPPP